IGEMDNHSKVNNVHATGNVTAESGGYVGGAVGNILQGTLSLAYATGNVIATSGVPSDVGGLARIIHSDGIVDKNFAARHLKGLYGGFVGELDGKITDAYARGNVSAVDTATVGGFAGEVEGGTINTSYTTGGVTSDTGFDTGAFVGFDDAGVYTHDYWDKGTS